uniref:Uncharacterized protein n=1 Tax=Rousettus aegyptiacus TaxID=9407 RepID=A0A7J8JHJ9_ROUAE|nr:hypothetical protein HJG63_010240 [Rousettus aegyptiacus]
MLVSQALVSTCKQLVALSPFLCLAAMERKQYLILTVSLFPPGSFPHGKNEQILSLLFSPVTSQLIFHPMDHSHIYKHTTSVSWFLISFLNLSPVPSSKEILVSMTFTHFIFRGLISVSNYQFFPKYLSH